MIEINLLPGSGKKARRGGGTKVDIGAMIAGVRDKIREPWLIGAVATSGIALALCASLFLAQNKREAKLEEDVQKAVQDSTRYASVLREREKAEAKRDTVLRSLNLIRAIDDDRFVWPHILDEVSRALPPYTWLVSLGFTGTGQGQSTIATMAPPAPEPGKRVRKGAVNTNIPRDTVHMRLVGNTVDIQALTRFMKQLESSPFLENVQLAKSERAQDNGKEITQFQLDMLYSRPDPAFVRRVPLAVSVR
jgi:Tfp pilus assembly protein PilN